MTVQTRGHYIVYLWPLNLVAREYLVANHGEAACNKVPSSAYDPYTVVLSPLLSRHSSRPFWPADGQARGHAAVHRVVQLAGGRVKPKLFVRAVTELGVATVQVDVTILPTVLAIYVQTLLHHASCSLARKRRG